MPISVHEIFALHLCNTSFYLLKISNYVINNRLVKICIVIGLVSKESKKQSTKYWNSDWNDDNNTLGNSFEYIIFLI